MKRRQKITVTKPRRTRHTHHHELEASIQWTPAKAYEGDYENPDWLVGAN